MEDTSTFGVEMETEKEKGIHRNKETVIYIELLLLYLRRNEEGMPQTLPIFRESTPLHLHLSLQRRKKQIL